MPRGLSLLRALGIVLGLACGLTSCGSKSLIPTITPTTTAAGWSSFETAHFDNNFRVKLAVCRGMNGQQATVQMRAERQNDSITSFMVMWSPGPGVPGMSGRAYEAFTTREAVVVTLTDVPTDPSIDVQITTVTGSSHVYHVSRLPRDLERCP